MTWNTIEKDRIKSLVTTATINSGSVAWYKSVIIPKIIKNKAIYKEIASVIKCPLAMVPLIHTREMGSDVGLNKCYLGNGQPFNKVTTIVPKGRGPFESFQAGAIDSLRLDGIDKITDWSLERMLFELEGYNGYGYRTKGINSPYIWTYTNHYTSSLYVADGQYSATAVSKNIGCFPLYQLLIDADKEFVIGAEAIIPNLNIPDELLALPWFETFRRWLIGLLESILGVKVPSEALDPDPIIVSKEPTWMIAARKELGQKEIVGLKHNPRIIEYGKATTLKPTTDEVPWCACFANWALLQAGIKGTGTAWARDFLSWGVPIKEPRIGCIAVYERNGTGGDSHVCFWDGKSGSYDRGLGGNQSNSVSIANHGVGDLLGYRWPKDI